MPQLMSVAMTEQAVLDRTKTVTRRKGWWINKHGRRLLVPGDRLTLCRKVMGRKKDEPLVPLAQVEVIDVRREPLNAVLGGTAPWWTEYGRNEMTLEGFPGRDPHWFVAELFTIAQGIQPDAEITRVEWRYLP